MKKQIEKLEKTKIEARDFADGLDQVGDLLGKKINEIVDFCNSLSPKEEEIVCSYCQKPIHDGRCKEMSPSPTPDTAKEINDALDRVYAPDIDVEEELEEYASYRYRITKCEFDFEECDLCQSFRKRMDKIVATLKALTEKKI
jgi:hypothetical protein